MEENQQLSDIFTTLYVLSNSLMEGHPLPAYLPKLRERVIYHEFHTGRRSINPSFVKSMFSLPPSSDVKGVDNVQAVETDSSSEVNGSGIAPMAGPATVDGSSLGIELDDLTLDVLLVSLCFDRCRSSSVDTSPPPPLG